MTKTRHIPKDWIHTAIEHRAADKECGRPYWQCQCAACRNVRKNAEPMDFETFASKMGGSRQAFGEAGVHKRSRRISDKQWSRIIQHLQKQDTKLAFKRDGLRMEYNDLVYRFILRPLTRKEKLIQIAGGHPDKLSVQAARRVLAKQFNINSSHAAQPKGDRPMTKKKKKKVAKKLSAVATATATKPSKKKVVKKVAKALANAKTKKARAQNKISANDATARILKKADKPLGAGEIYKRISSAGLWKTNAKKPENIIYGGLMAEIDKKGNKSRFSRIKRKGFILMNGAIAKAKKATKKKVAKKKKATA